MMRENICKYIEGPRGSELDISWFVLEADESGSYQPHKLGRNQLILVSEGSGFFKFDDERVPFSVGSLIFGFSGETFLPEPDGNCKYMYIRFAGPRAEELFRRFNITPVTREFAGFDGLIPLWSESLSRADKQTVDLAAESMLLYSFSRLSGNITEHNSLISKIIEISESQFTDPSLSVATIAEALGYNAKYVSHIFKKKTGVGYSEYLKTLRIKYAVTLFDHGIESVKNVALLSGFTDPLYFSTIFKKSVGMSPKEYRMREKN